MKRTGSGRVLATLLLGVMFGIFRHFQQVRELAAGRDAFVAGQNAYFDKIQHYHSGATMLIAGVLLAAAVVGLYELIAAGFTRVLPPSTVEE